MKNGNNIINIAIWIGILAEIIIVNVILFDYLGSGSINNPNTFKGILIVITIYLAIVFFAKVLGCLMPKSTKN